jgi:hypothetical protein
MPDQKDYSDYDSEPVVCCVKCFSLKIKYEEAIDSDCCMECGSTDVVEMDISEWEKNYEKRYGKRFIVKSNDPKKSPIFNMPISKLKDTVYNSPEWKKIIHTLYPFFPKGVSRADSIIFLFDRLVRDNRLDDLKLLLWENNKNKLLLRHGREKQKNSENGASKEG